MRETRTYGNGISIYRDTETRDMGLIATTKRGHRHLEKRAKAAGKTVDAFCREALTDALGSVGVTVDPARFRCSISAAP